MSKQRLTKEEERQILQLTEQSDEWVSVGKKKEREAFWREAAERTSEGKRTRISISVNADDLARLRSEAIRSGIPYQTIINHLIRTHVRQG